MPKLNKIELRWKFILDGHVAVVPHFKEDGLVEYMLVETEYSATKCYSPREVDMAIDIAMYQKGECRSVYIH